MHQQGQRLQQQQQMEQQRVQQQAEQQQREEQQREQQRLKRQQMEQLKAQQQAEQQQREQQQREEQRLQQQQQMEQLRAQQQREEQQREQQRLQQQQMEQLKAQQQAEQQQHEQQQREEQRLQQQQQQQQQRHREQQRMEQQMLEEQRLKQQHVEQLRAQEQCEEQQREQQRLQQEHVARLYACQRYQKITQEQQQRAKHERLLEHQLQQLHRRGAEQHDCCDDDVSLPLPPTVIAGSRRRSRTVGGGPLPVQRKVEGSAHVTAAASSPCTSQATSDYGQPCTTSSPVDGLGAARGAFLANLANLAVSWAADAKERKKRGPLDLPRRLRVEPSGRWPLHSALSAVLTEGSADGPFALFAASSTDMTALGNLFVKHFDAPLHLQSMQAASYPGNLPPVVTDAWRWAATKAAAVLAELLPDTTIDAGRRTRSSHPRQHDAIGRAAGVEG
jgi:acyl transferase domain-containing protein